MPRRKIFAFTPRFREYALLPEDWEVGAYDDILAAIRIRGSLDLLGGSPDLGGEEGPGAVIGPPYQATNDRRLVLLRQYREAKAKAEYAEVERAYQARQQELQQQRQREREAAFSKLRQEPVLADGTMTCLECGLGGQQIWIPPPHWDGRDSFVYLCAGCGAEIGCTSKRLAQECNEMWDIVYRYGSPPRLNLDMTPFRIQPLPPDLYPPRSP